MTAIEYHHQISNVEYSLKRFACKLTSKDADAKDLFQETILKVLINKDKYINNTNFRAWTFTIMKNIFLNNYRWKSRRKENIDIDNELFYVNELKSNESDDPSSTYLALEINQNIDRLKENLKVPFKMHINGYKYKEIADELNLNMGTIKNRIFLSRKLLMNQLHE